VPDPPPSVTGVAAWVEPPRDWDDRLEKRLSHLKPETLFAADERVAMALFQA
jgi:hypothetical protein